MALATCYRRDTEGSSAETRTADLMKPYSIRLVYPCIRGRRSKHGSMSASNRIPCSDMQAHSKRITLCI